MPPPPPPSPYGYRPPYAGFWARFGAYLLDSLLFLLFLIPFAIGSVVFFRKAFEDCVWVDTDGGSQDLRCPANSLNTGALGGGIAFAALGLIVVSFVFLRMLAKSGQTWGRKAAGVKVVRIEDGSPPGWGRAIGRTAFAWFISGQVCYLGYLWMLWDSQNQTWHDKVASTVVVRT